MAQRRSPLDAHRRDALDRLPGLRAMIERGTAGHPRAVRRRMELANATGLLVAASGLAFGVPFAVADFHRYWGIVAVNAVHVLLGLAIPRLHRWGHLAGALVLTNGLQITLFSLAWMVGRDTGVQLNYLVGAVLPFVLFGMEHLGIAIAIAATSHILHLVAWIAFPPERALVPIGPPISGVLYASAATTAFVVAMIVVIAALRRARAAEREVASLLHRALPESVASRLLERPGEPVADRSDQVAVLFADLVGFTPLTRRLGPDVIVATLDEVFRRFDEHAARLGVEKVKTVGDAYMAMAGLPSEVKDPAGALIRLGEAMLDEIAAVSEATGYDLDVRIGIALGPAVAGVIGTSRYLYDVWGDTVNLAARLEASGVPGRIQVSDAVRAAVGDAFAFEDRGEVELKGIGPTHAWLVVGSLAAAPPTA